MTAFRSLFLFAALLFGSVEAFVPVSDVAKRPPLALHALPLKQFGLVNKISAFSLARVNNVKNMARPFVGRRVANAFRMVFTNEVVRFISVAAVFWAMVQFVLYPQILIYIERELRQKNPEFWNTHFESRMKDGENLTNRPDLVDELLKKLVPSIMQSKDTSNTTRKLLSLLNDEIMVVPKPIPTDSQTMAAKQQVDAKAQLEAAMNELRRESSGDGIQDEEIHPELWQDARSNLNDGNVWMRLKEVNSIVKQVEERENLENENMNSREIYWALDEAEDAFSQIREHRPDLLHVYESRVKKGDDVLVRMEKMKNIMAAEVYARRLVELKAEYAVNRFRKIPDLRERYDDEVQGGEDVFSRVKKMHAIYSAWVEARTNNVESKDPDGKVVDSNDGISEWE